jgi:hypothetical protein
MIVRTGIAVQMISRRTLPRVWTGISAGSRLRYRTIAYVVRPKTIAATTAAIPTKTA